MVGDSRSLRVIAVAALAFAGTQAQAAALSQKARESYSIGYQVGSEVRPTLQQQGLKADPAMLARGVQDAISGHKPLLSVSEIHATLQQLARERLVQLRKMAAANQKEGAAFLAANKKKKGVVTLPSGLQYQVLKSAKGPHPTLADAAVVNYKASFPNGHVFAQHRGSVMAIQTLVPGLKQALLMMTQGSKWRIVLPPELGFGENGPPPIGPDRTLVFEVHMTGIRTPQSAAPGKP
ncbi:MAG TPA: FKBP-type peptidyl-prolyl cis-trans isomerase [Acidiferrobacteraceae bacterium]|nr:FKBP-type peptidyl-prolyl cis-trans isomerase [Acidiferrobacteraceae bacterium]